MRRALILVVLLWASASMAQHRSMRVLLPCRDVPAYSRFLHTFGFLTIDSLRDICRMSDGQVFVTLMQMNDLSGVHLALFVDDIAHLDSVLSNIGGVNSFRDENGVLNEIDVKAPGGITLFVHQSLQGSVAKPAMTINPACGAFVEFSVSVTDLPQAVAFWKIFGFEPSYSGNDPLPMSCVSNGSFSIGLHQNPNTEPSITYASKNAADQIAAIRKRSVEPILSQDDTHGAGASFQAPEGLIVNIFGVK
jgi:hypothetical protein